MFSCFFTVSWSTFPFTFTALRGGGKTGAVGTVGGGRDPRDDERFRRPDENHPTVAQVRPSAELEAALAAAEAANADAQRQLAEAEAEAQRLQGQLEVAESEVQEAKNEAEVAKSEAKVAKSEAEAAKAEARVAELEAQ
eukprot:894947-Prorocentrum_minimum.AAC.2